MKHRTRVTVELAPSTFGGLAVPDLIAGFGSDGAEKYCAYFADHVFDRQLRREYASAIDRFCSWVEEYEYSLRGFSPLLLSAYLEMQKMDGIPMAAIRNDWQALRLFFSWLYLVGMVRINVGAAVPDPLHGFLCEDAEPNKPAAIDVSATFVLPA